MSATLAHRARAAQSAGRRRAGQRRRASSRQRAPRARRARRRPGAVPRADALGYPPEDLLFHRGFRRQIEQGAGARCATRCAAIGVMVGFPEYTHAGIYNSAALIATARSPPSTARRSCPTTRCSTRSATSSPARSRRWSSVKGLRVGPAGLRGHLGAASRRSARARRGAQLLIVINASPYEIHKQREREDVARARVARRRLAGRLRESARRPGRAGVRRQLVRDGRAGRGRACARPPFDGGQLSSSQFVRDARGRVVPLAGSVAAGAPGRGERLQRAGARRARLRQQARLSRAW